eukprot:TRINITY_DN2953_c0_g2_i1.p1 TRINITY_DN2953_c0_g2~~TRINITY_DN2953_c0_g2_i1.p1  ORF type:complete len:160 (+),score=20.08 TRINITY_DN2953_c0_g2_i1:33-482(+)
MTDIDLTQLDHDQFYSLYESVLNEHNNRMSKKKASVILHIGEQGGEHFVFDVPAITLLSDFKEVVEESYLYLDKTPMPGPSANWTYKHKDEIADPSKPLSAFVESIDEPVVIFQVTPPKKRKREVEASVLPSKKQKVDSSSPTTVQFAR